ncbi:alpha/beta hydrolase [Gorillibacterium massiliense]|uniref:alpha/beta hydrolase n=1 Tax=Gorillibacterium massiliense TaxID=1280390 RepID=UPI0004AD6C7E|nr:alpha/beta hydrolase-fold protein [Gorillibacterium massiliense]
MGVKPILFFSGALNARKMCFVYTPPSYNEETDRRYPVVYLLHGLYGGEPDWLERGGAEDTLNRLIAEKRLQECIAVIPGDGGYGQGTFYMDWYDGSGNFEQYITDDLVPFIDKEYRTIATRETRGITGFSMGGFGALSLALHRSDLFGAAASLSGALGSVLGMSSKEFARSDFPRITGPANGPYAKERDLYLLAVRRLGEGTAPAFYFNCGTEDYLLDMNRYYRSHLEKIGYSHRYEEFPGEHGWPYASLHLQDALLFLEENLSKGAAAE